MRPGTVRFLPLAVSIALAAAGCDASPGPGSSAAASSPGSSVSAAPMEPRASTDPATSAPARTPLPGFEDWATVNPQAVRMAVEDGALTLELIGSVLWFNAERGVLLSREVTGDFRATATVRTARTSDPSLAPGADGTIQLAGLMARTEVPAENYVFIVSGSIGHSTGLETKTTTSSTSIYVQRGQPTEGDADLKLCRVGPEFTLSWRPAASDGAWTLMSTFPREDMPPTLQVGANIYTDSAPDITARFENFTIEPLLEGDAAC